MTTAPSPRPRAAGVLARMVASLLVLSIVLACVDLRGLASALLGASPARIAGAGLWMLASIAGAGVVWWCTFPPGAKGLRLADAVRHTLVGASLNSLLPTSGVAGDFYRGWACWREGVAATAGATSVVLARWCSLTALCVSMWTMWALLPALSSEWPRRLGLAVALGLTLLITAVSVLMVLPALLGGRGASRLPSFLTKMRVLDVSATDLSGELVAFFRAPTRVAAALGVAVVALAMEGVSLWFAAVAVGAGREAALFALLAPAVRLVHQVPGFFNAVGLQEVTLMQAGASMGVGPDVAIAISLLVHGVRVGVALLGLPLYWTSGLITANPVPTSEGEAAR